jgi:CubicO group peptidase (beta-lactamase class C family)
MPASGHPLETADVADVHGFCAPGWEGVRAAFTENIESGLEVGASYAVHHDGRLVVDLWGGTYQADTLQLVFSTTKGWTAVLANLLAQRGELDVDAPVASYWPEFAAEGKGAIPVRWLLCHKAGLPYPTEPCTYEDVLAWDPVVAKLAASAPLWEPGTAHGYHAVTYGFLVGEVLRRITGKSVGTMLRDEVAGPLGLDLWIGLPEEEQHRVAPLDGGLVPDGGGGDVDPGMKELLAQFMGPDSMLGKALSCNGALGEPGMFNRPELRAAELPAANGVGDARSLSRLYAAVIGDVHADERFPAGSQLVTPDTTTAASTRQTEGNDKVLFFETTFGLGFFVASQFAPYGGPASFGHTGAGGSLGFADPDNGLGCGYVMSKMQQSLNGDARSGRLIRATYDAIGVEPTYA